MSDVLVVRRFDRPSEILQDRCLAKLMARSWIRCAVYYITFKTSFSCKEHMKSDAHMMETGSGDVNGRFIGEFMVLLDGSSRKD